MSVLKFFLLQCTSYLSNFSVETPTQVPFTTLLRINISVFNDGKTNPGTSCLSKLDKIKTKPKLNVFVQYFSHKQ